ncbi:hypothetical protein [Yeosuana sp. AK3]
MKTATSIVSLLLATIIIFNSLRISFTYAYYYLDTSGFIEKLCENKDKPELQCNGKCQLMKVAQNNQAADDKVPFKYIDFKEITLFVVEQDSYHFLSHLSRTSHLNDYDNLYRYSLTHSLDHPPQV